MRPTDTKSAGGVALLASALEACHKHLNFLRRYAMGSKRQCCCSVPQPKTNLLMKPFSVRTCINYFFGDGFKEYMYHKELERCWMETLMCACKSLFNYKSNIGPSRKNVFRCWMFPPGHVDFAEQKWYVSPNSD